MFSQRLELEERNGRIERLNLTPQLRRQRCCRAMCANDERHVVPYTEWVFATIRERPWQIENFHRGGREGGVSHVAHDTDNRVPWHVRLRAKPAAKCARAGGV